MTLQTEDLSFSYGPRPVLHQVNLLLKPEVTALIGPNATGKSTLLKCLSGLLTPAGRVTLNGQELRAFSRRELSRSISYLPQSNFQRGRLTVFETVLLGRLHDLSWRVSPAEIDRTHRLLNEMALTPLAGRLLSELSGGQAQLVSLAQSLNREPTILLLDEPTSSLDLSHQLEICTRLQEMTRSRGLVTVVSLHDLNLAARYADRVIVLHQGTVYSAGPPSQVLTSQMMADVYHVNAEFSHTASGVPCLIVDGPLPTAESAGL